MPLAIECLALLWHTTEIENTNFVTLEGFGMETEIFVLSYCDEYKVVSVPLEFVHFIKKVPRPWLAPLQEGSLQFSTPSICTESTCILENGHPPLKANGKLFVLQLSDALWALAPKLSTNSAPELLLKGNTVSAPALVLYPVILPELSVIHCGREFKLLFNLLTVIINKPNKL